MKNVSLIFFFRVSYRQRKEPPCSDICMEQKFNWTFMVILWRMEPWEQSWLQSLQHLHQEFYYKRWTKYWIETESDHVLLIDDCLGIVFHNKDFTQPDWLDFDSISIDTFKHWELCKQVSSLFFSIH